MAEVTPMRGNRMPHLPCHCCNDDEFTRADERRAAAAEIQKYDGLVDDLTYCASLDTVDGLGRR